MSAAEHLQTKFQTVPLRKFVADDTAAGTFTGYASTYGGDPDSHGDIIAPGAFADSLAEHERKGTRPAMLWQHDQTRPIGAWESFEDSEQGLLAHGRLTLDVPEAKSAHALMRDEALALSIGYMLDPADVELVNGARLLKRIHLMEISVVAMPANTSARIVGLKAAFNPDAPNPREFEKALRDAGLSANQSKRLLSGGWRALARDESEDDAEKVAVLVKQLQRITERLRG